MSANFADWIALSPDYSLVETVIPRGWIGKSLQDLDVRRKYGINVVGIKVGEDIEVNPNPEKALEDGMVKILVGANKDLENI